MGNDGQSNPPSSADTPLVSSENITPDGLSTVLRFFDDLRYSSAVPSNLNYQGSYSDLFSHLLELRHIEGAKISCLFTVKPSIQNFYRGMHGGAVAAVAEILSLACARTVVGKEKELFLGESSTSYLSAAPHNARVIVDASVVRTGRNLTVVSVEFKLEGSSRLVYTSRSTFFHMPAASL